MIKLSKWLADNPRKADTKPKLTVCPSKSDPRYHMFVSGCLTKKCFKTKEDVIATYQQAITNTMASWKQQCGDDVTVSFAIKGMSEQSQDFLTEWTDDMNEMIGEDKVHAQDAVTLNVERTLTGSKGTQTETISPTLIQVDGFWYILQENTTAADSQQATE